MAKPADMQCKALLGGATKHAVAPNRCPYLRTRILNQSGAWSVYCKGHRMERTRMRDAGKLDETGDRAAPVAIRKTQTQRDRWVAADAKGWKRGDPI